MSGHKPISGLRANLSGPSKAQVERLLEHHRGLIARMTEEERSHLRDSLGPEEAVADGMLEHTEGDEK